MLSRRDLEQVLSASYSTRSSNNFTKSDYDDFSVPIPHRSARIVVEGRVLYVNDGWLAELSPLFASTFFGEDAVKEMTLPSDVTYEEFLELMRVSFHCPKRKPVTVSNVSVVMPLAYRFNMLAVVKRCEEVIAREVGMMNKTKLFEVATAVSQCDRHSHVMTALIDTLSSLSDYDLTSAQFNQVPGDVVADVFATKMKRSQMKTKKWCCLF